MGNLLDLKLREISCEYATNKNEEILNNLLELVGENRQMNDYSFTNNFDKMSIKYSNVIDGIMLGIFTYEFEKICNTLKIVGYEEMYNTQLEGLFMYGGNFLESIIPVGNDYVLGESKIDKKCLKRVR